jgi:enediyne biosynthesis protein E4
MWIAAVLACTDDGAVHIPAPGGSPELVAAADVGVSSKYEGLFFGHYNRGRAAVALDVDNDGDLDEISGNPGDVTYLVRNVSPVVGEFAFEAGQVFADDEDLQAWWGGTAADYDNDGDQDVFIAFGGNDQLGTDRFLRNDLLADRSNADAPFSEVADQIGIGFVSPGGDALRTYTMGSVFFDADLDGWLDVYGATLILPEDIGTTTPEEGLGLELLYRNLGDGTFDEVGYDVGLTSQRSSRNPSVLDFDRDGDFDIFEANFLGGSILWQNDLRETGTLSFRDVTQQRSLGGGDLSFPQVGSTFCTLASDLNNDGYEDLISFRRGAKDEPDEPEVHDIGHLLWINVQGTGFVEVASHTTLNHTFYFRDHDNGVMGCQHGDLDADGFPDIIIGTGSPLAGGPHQLYLSTERTEVDIPGVGVVVVPQFEDVSHFLDVSGLDSAYPYRGHGTTVADYDGDGLPELGLHHGGPMYLVPDDAMQEPNQLFVFEYSSPPHWLRVALRGDGVSVNRDGVGAVVQVHVNRDTEPDLYEVRHTGEGFGSQNDPVLFFGLGESDQVDWVEVTWPDGVVHRVDTPAVDEVLLVER